MLSEAFLRIFLMAVQIIPCNISTFPKTKYKGLIDKFEARDFCFIQEVLFLEVV